MSDEKQKRLVAELLDAALTEYSQVEPKMGLEERILTNLRTERQAAQRIWWKWGPAMAGAAVTLTILIAITLTNRSVNLAWGTAEVAQNAVITKVNEENAVAPAIGNAVPEVRADDDGQPDTADLGAARSGRGFTVASASAFKRDTRKLRAVDDVAAPQVIAQTKAPGSEGLRIEELKIPDVILDEIVIKQNEHDQ